MSLLTTRVSGLAAIAVSMLALAACSSPKKTPPPVAAVTNPPPAASQATPPSRSPEPPRASNLPPPQTGPVPGSAQDFVIATGGDRVYFDYDSSQIRSDAEPILAAQAAWLVKYPAVAVRIEGNADERGTREYNFALGAERANAVKEYLIRKGVGAGRIETVSYGKERPIDAGSSETSFAKNRNGHTAITGGAR